jgi:uncharacterized protein YegP (UPF0339 family)
MPSKIIIKQNQSGYWYPEIRAGNNEIIMPVESYFNAGGCVKGLMAIKKALEKGVALIEFETGETKVVDLETGKVT